MTTTQKYFEMSKEELREKKNEYTKEECVLLDENAHFYNNEQDSAEGAQWLRKQGYCILTVLKMTDERIAVLTV